MGRLSVMATTFPAGLPKLNISAAQWPSTADFPNHSYGIAGDFHPPSFEICLYTYRSEIAEDQVIMGGKQDKRKEMI
jgi:hypothetical protein